MEPDTATVSEAEYGARVMAAIEAGDGEDAKRLVVADLEREDAYITLPLSDAASLPAWR